MPTWRERAGIGVVPRTDTVPDAETPSAEAVIVVKPTRSGLTMPPSSTVASVGSALCHASAVAGTAAPDESVARTAIGVSEPTAVGVIAGKESAVTLLGGAGCAAGGTGVGDGPWTTAEAGAEAELGGALASSSLPPPQPTHSDTIASRARLWIGLIVA